MSLANRVPHVLVLLFLLGCAPVATGVATTAPTAAPDPCDAHQAGLSREADQRASPWSIVKHLAKNFPDHKVSWLMKDGAYQTYIIKTGAQSFGRCDATGCYLFAAPTTAIHEAVQQSQQEGRHDAAALGHALGLPADNFEGTLRMMTLDIAGICVRLPIETDPGTWKCSGPQDRDCFHFGGYTSGGAPEIMVINAPVGKTEIVEVP